MTKEKHVLFEEAELIEFVPECMVMAMPETPAQVERAVENLESRREKIWEDIQGVPREIYNDRGEKRLNVEWLRLWAQLQTSDKKAKHTAAAMQTDALNKGTENLKETSKKVFQSKCNSGKSKLCA